MASWFDLRGTTLNTFSIGIKKTKFDSSNVTVQRSFILPDKNIDFTGGAVGQVIGITSASQIGWVSKQNTITGAATTINGTDLTPSKALISNSSGKIEISNIDSSALNFLSNVTSNIQTQINNKQNIISGGATTITFSNLNLSKALVSNAFGKIDTSSVSSSTIQFLSGLISNPQNQISSKVESASNQGSGTSIFTQKVGTNLEFKSLIAGPNVTISENNNSITLDATYGGASIQENTYTILDNQSNNTLETLTDKTRCYDINYSINRTTTGTDLRNLVLPNQTVNISNNSLAGVKTIAFQNDGKVLIGGQNTNFLSNKSRCLMRFNSDGSEDTIFSTNALYSGSGYSGNYYFNSASFTTTTVNKVSVDEVNQKICITGEFTNYKNQTGKNHVLFLNIDGTEDTTFMNNAVVNGVTPRFSGSVQSNHIQADGKVIIVGGFSAWSGSTNKNCLMRFNSNGTEDTTFTNNAVANGAVARFSAGFISAVTTQSDGKVLVGGTFTNWNGETGKSYLLRFNSNGTEDTAFTANAVRNVTTPRFNAQIWDIKILSNGKILVVGDFNNYNAVTGVNKVVLLNSDGTLDSTFTTNASSSSAFSAIVYSADQMSDGSLIITGNFINYKTLGINRLIRLNLDGTLYTPSSFNDYNANPNVLFYQWGTVNQRYVVRIKNDLIYIGGAFGTLYGGNGFGRLNGDGTDNPFFVPMTFGGVATGAIYTNNNPNVRVCVKQTDNKIIFGGFFRNFKGFLNASNLIRLNADYSIDTTFFENAVIRRVTIGGTNNIPISNFTNSIADIAIQSDGKILVCGGFSNWRGDVGKSFLLRLNSDGTEDTAFTANAVISGGAARFNGFIGGIIVQSDGKILVYGGFTNWSGIVGKNFLLRLNSDGTEDTAFSANAINGGKFNNSISRIAIGSDQRPILVGGFTSYNGVTGNNFVVRLGTNGIEDTGFRNLCVLNGSTPRFNNFVNWVDIQSDGKILICGQFTDWSGGTGKSSLMRFNSDGSEDTIFTGNAVRNGTTARFNSSVNAVAVETTGKIFAVGLFTNYDGITNLSKVVALNSDGTKFTSMNSQFARSMSDSNNNFNSSYISKFNDGTVAFVGFRTQNMGSPYATFFSQQSDMCSFISDYIRSQNGNILAIPTNTGFQFSSPSTTGPDPDMPTGVTMTFNTNGTINYSSNALSLPSSAIRNIKIQKHLV